MSLNTQKMEMVRKLEGGITQARCPACAEGGQDRAGEHLRIYPDGRFGCCVHPKDPDHRKRIFALAGVRERQAIKVRVPDRSGGEVQPGILGRLGRVFQTPIPIPEISDASDGVFKVQSTIAEVRTLRTGVANSNNGSLAEGDLPLEESRTLRTGTSNPYVYAKEIPKEIIESTYKEFPDPVRSVREAEQAADGGEAELESRTPVRSVRDREAAVQPPAAVGEKLPYLTSGGTLVIPFAAPEGYHWWQGGQSVTATLTEVRAGGHQQQGREHASEV